MRLIRKGLVVAGLSAIGIMTFAGRADAHHPLYSEDCTHIQASGTSYPAGAHAQLVVDGQNVFNETFDGGDFATSHQWSPASSHKYHLVITSPDLLGEVDWAGTQVACVPATTTVAPTTTTNPTSQLPPVTIVPTTVPVVTTIPPTTVPVSVEATTTVPSSDTSIAESSPLPPSTVVRQQLPATGIDGSPMLTLAGIGVILIGAIFLVTGRRAES